MDSKFDIISEAKRVFEIEATAILDLKSRLNEKFIAAVDLILGCQGRVIVTGMGKSGIIGKKIAATLSSTGTPSFFVHPAEGSHGDLGMISSQDVVIAISYSGETAEILPILNYVGRKNIPLISLTGKIKSSIADASNVALDVGVREEACPMGLAPTASTTAALAMGDALSMAVLLRRGFRPEDFAEFHPGGRLGARLLTRVRDVMHSGEGLPLVERSTRLKELIFKMTSKDVRGVAGVVDGTGDLLGIVTDGDIRRRLDRNFDLLSDTVEEIMSLSPKTVDMGELAEKALFMMEQFSIQVLFVTDRQSPAPHRPVGLLHLQDLLKSKIR